MSHDTTHTQLPAANQPGALKSYILGFVLSIVLTLLSYFAVVGHILAGWSLVFVIVTFAILQMAVQLLFFLHLDREAKPRWNLLIFLFTVMILLVVVAGSLWIIYNLDGRMMPMGKGMTHPAGGGPKQLL